MTLRQAQGNKMKKSKEYWKLNYPVRDYIMVTEINWILILVPKLLLGNILNPVRDEMFIERKQPHPNPPQRGGSKKSPPLWGGFRWGFLNNPFGIEEKLKTRFK